MKFLLKLSMLSKENVNLFENYKNLLIHMYVNFLNVQYRFSENKKALQFLERLDFIRGPTWARTRDHLIMSQVL